MYTLPHTSSCPLSRCLLLLLPGACLQLNTTCLMEKATLCVNAGSPGSVVWVVSACGWVQRVRMWGCVCACACACVSVSVSVRVVCSARCQRALMDRTHYVMFPCHAYTHTHTCRTTSGGDTRMGSGGATRTQPSHWGPSMCVSGSCMHMNCAAGGAGVEVWPCRSHPVSCHTHAPPHFYSAIPATRMPLFRVTSLHPNQRVGLHPEPCLAVSNHYPECLAT